MINIICNNNLFFNKKKKSLIDIKKFVFKKTYLFFISININYINNDLTLDSKINASLDFLNKNDSKTLNVIRHSCAHILANSLVELYPGLKLSIGPVIKNGFYYDFFLNKKISFNNLKDIEKKMIIIIKKNLIIKKINIEKSNAEIIFFKNKYKKNIISNIKHDKEISIYKQGKFEDLCRGPHVYSTNFLKYFKLVKISGAYWKNNEKNEMLYRIYGTAWECKKNLVNYITKLNNVKNFDHRILGKKLNLFNFYDHSPGVVFWNKNGWYIFNLVKKYIKDLLKKINYFEVNTPVMTGNLLFKLSGHIEKFSENMFFYYYKNVTSVLKPMSCPCHANIFSDFNNKSYKNLPFRISEFGSCFRNELSGALHGLMRLKNFTQDDGHIFCSNLHLENELMRFIHILKKTYYKFGFESFKIVLSKKPFNIINNLDIWAKAENILEMAVKKLNMNYTISCDGAFYGPKLEFSLRDNFTRLWQCGTIQVDFFTSTKLNVKYIDHKGSLINPIILHRAILGSIERFVGVLLEHNKGFLPFWLTPIHFILIYINHKYLFYIKNIYNIIKKKYNIEVFFGTERLEYKIKQTVLKKIPYIIIIGEKEFLNKSLTIRNNKTNTIITVKIIDFFKNFQLEGD